MIIFKFYYFLNLLKNALEQIKYIKKIIIKKMK